MNSQVLIDRVFLQDLLFLIKQPRTKIDARAVLVFGIERALPPVPIPDAGGGVVAWPEGGSDTVEAVALGEFDRLGRPEHDLESWCAGYAEAIYKHAMPSIVSALQASAMVVPDSYKLVPIEPTEAMLNACLMGGKYENRLDLRPAIYRAMLAAAPSKEQQ